MRLYTITNMYLSSIQNGIQSAHVVHEMYEKYTREHVRLGPSRDFLREWATNHKTMICLNGGMTEHMELGLEQIRDVLHPDANGSFPYPWATFHEPGIGNALTCIAIVVPEEIYAKDDEQDPTCDVYIVPASSRLSPQQLGLRNYLLSLQLAK